MIRINEISKYISSSDIVADVGCDQVQLGILLARKDIKSYASDISKNVIDKAYDKINRLGYSKYITLINCDGTSKLPQEVNTLVLAGMGYYTIIDILSSSKKYDKVITICNNKNYLLRKYMFDSGYFIYEEKIIYEKNKYYNLIVFKKGIHKYTEKDIYTFNNIIKDDIYYKYVEYYKNKYNLISSKNKDINNILKYLE